MPQSAVNWQITVGLLHRYCRGVFCKFWRGLIPAFVVLILQRVSPQIFLAIKRILQTIEALILVEQWILFCRDAGELFAVQNILIKATIFRIEIFLALGAFIMPD